MIQKIIDTGEYRGPLFDKSKKLEQYVVTLPLEIRNEVDNINIEQWIANGILDYMNHYKDSPYKDKVWIWIHALESFITIEGFINTADEEEAIELTELFNYDCYFDLIDDEAIYI